MLGSCFVSHHKIFSDTSAIDARNQVYRAMCEARATAENYSDRHAQTVTRATKSSTAMALPPATAEAACTATSYDIYDAVHDGDKADTGPETASTISRMVESSLAEKGVLLSSQEESSSMPPLPRSMSAIETRAAAKLLSSPALRSKLLLMERAVQQNINHNLQLQYRNIPMASEIPHAWA